MKSNLLDPRAILVVCGLLASAASAQVTTQLPKGGGAPVTSDGKANTVQPDASKPVPAEGAPQLTFDHMNHDFGSIVDTKNTETEFKFTNKGSGKLIFTSQPRASCGCTAPALDKLEYAPGESGAIKVIYKPQGKRGAQAQTVTVETNDPLQQSLKLEIKALVEPVVTLEPMVINFDEVMANSESKQIVTVTGRAANFAATYASVGKLGKYIQAKVIETKEVEVDGVKRPRTTIEYTLKPGAPRGAISSLSTIRTTDPDAPLHSVQIIGEVVGDIKLIPGRVNIGVVQPGETFQRTFRVVSRRNSEFKITGNEQTSGLAEMMKVDVKPIEGQVGYEVTITGRAPEQPSPITGTLTLKTDVQDEGEIAIPLSGNVRPKPAVPTPVAPQTGGPVGPEMPDATPAPQPAPGTDGAPR